jgi:hypothetical protein
MPRVIIINQKHQNAEKIQKKDSRQKYGGSDYAEDTHRYNIAIVS